MAIDSNPRPLAHSGPGTRGKWTRADPRAFPVEKKEQTYWLHVRKDGWPDWVRLGEEHLTGSNYDWDTTAVPPGLYRVRLTASDRPSNNPEDALSRERTSEPFIVDHEVPRVTLTAKPQGGICGTSSVAAGHPAVVRATHRIACTPQPIGTNASQSRPNGNSSSAISPAGITHSAVSGTAIMFATTK